MTIIREMTREDVKPVSTIEEETFSMPWSEAAFLDMIEDRNAHYLVADEEGKIIGSCGLRDIVGEGEITNVAVKQEYRNRGIGFLMLCELIEAGRQRGIEAFTLEVRESNAAAIHIYEKLGFKTEGMRRNFYEKPIEDAAIMWKR